MRAKNSLEVKSTVLDRPCRPEDLFTRALQDVVLCVVAKSAHRHRAADQLRLRWYHGVDAPPLKPSKHPRIGVARIGRDDLNINASCLDSGVDALDDELTFVDFAGGHLDVENHAADVIDDGVLVERWFEPAVASVRYHRRIGIADADLLELPRLAAVAFSDGSIFVRFGNRLDVAHRKAFPAHIRANE